MEEGFPPQFLMKQRTPPHPSFQERKDHVDSGRVRVVRLRTGKREAQVF